MTFLWKIRFCGKSADFILQFKKRNQLLKNWCKDIIKISCSSRGSGDILQKRMLYKQLYSLFCEFMFILLSAMSSKAEHWKLCFVHFDFILGGSSRWTAFTPKRILWSWERGRDWIRTTFNILCWQQQWA